MKNENLQEVREIFTTGSTDIEKKITMRLC